MKSSNIKYIASAFLVTMLFVNGAHAQKRQKGRQSQETNIQNPTGQNQMSLKDQQTLSEIEMMRREIRERRKWQEKQQREMEELKQLLDGEMPSNSAKQPIYNEPVYNDEQPIYVPTHSNQRVTSGSVLSQIEAQEREEMVQLQQKYDMEIQVAQKEIQMLQKQLQIANRQLDDCQSGSVSVNNVAYGNNFYTPTYSEPAAKQPKKAKPAKKGKAKEQPAQRQQVAEPQMSNENKQAMQEIEMMRNEIRERRKLYEKQQQMIEDLQRALN